MGKYLHCIGNEGTLGWLSKNKERSSYESVVTYLGQFSHASLCTSAPQNLCPLPRTTTSQKTTMAPNGVNGASYDDVDDIDYSDIEEKSVIYSL